MENHSKENVKLKQGEDVRLNEFQPDVNGHNMGKTYSTEDAEEDLNSKILKITLTIMDQYPE